MITVTVQSAYIAGAWCAEVRVPAPHGNGVLFVQQVRKVAMERAVFRVIKAIPRGTDLVKVQWRELGNIL